MGACHSEPYQMRIKYLCEDLNLLRSRLKDVARDLGRRVDEHEIGKLIMTHRRCGAVDRGLPDRGARRSGTLR